MSVLTVMTIMADWHRPTGGSIRQSRFVVRRILGRTGRLYPKLKTDRLPPIRPDPVPRKPVVTKEN
jgi:hypothetical protein